MLKFNIEGAGDSTNGGKCVDGMFLGEVRRVRFTGHGRTGRRSATGSLGGGVRIRCERRFGRGCATNETHKSLPKPLISRGVYDTVDAGMEMGKKSDKKMNLGGQVVLYI